MLDLFSTDQQDLQSSRNGAMASQVAPTPSQAFAAAWEATRREDGADAAFDNQREYVQQRAAAFTSKTGVDLPKEQIGDAGTFDTSYADWLKATRDRMTVEAQKRNDPSLLPPTDDDIVMGGLALARDALRRQAALGAGPMTPGSMAGSAAAGAVGSVSDPLNAISLAVAPEGGPLLASALRMGGAMAAQTLIGDVNRLGYRQRVDPEYGVGEVAGDVAGAFAGGALFGAGHALGGEGLQATLGAAAGGAIGGAAIGALQGGGPGALEGAVGGAALPLAGAGFGLSAKALGMSWRALVARSPDLAAAMPLDVRDAGTVAEKAGDLQAQSPWPGPAGDAAHGEAIGAAEDALVNGKPFDLSPAPQVEAAARRGQVFYPGGVIDARYGLAEHSDLVTSHDANFNVRPDYPADLQPRDRSSAPAQDQVNTIAANLEPDRLGPSPEANTGAPIVGPDGVVESGNGRVLAIGRAYDEGRAGAYQAWLERQGFDTSGYDKPVLVGMRETPLDDAGRAAFAHAANGSSSLRMSATEQALSDARHLDSSLVDLAKSPDLSAAANRDFARAFVGKLPQGERGGMLTRDGGLSANGVRRAQAAMAARAYGDPDVLARAFDHPDPNIKAVAGALTDAAAPWARMRDAATRGDIKPGHDITGDMLQAVKAIMRARDEKRPAWELLNQGDIFQSDTTQLAARMFFRDAEMRQPAGRKTVAESLTSYAEEAAKNTTAGRLFDDAVSAKDVLRRMAAKMFPGEEPESLFASLRRTPERLEADLETAEQDTLGRRRIEGSTVRPDASGADTSSAPPTLEDIAPRANAEKVDPHATREDVQAGEDLTLRNAKTGREAQAQSVASLNDALKAFDISRDTSADTLSRAISMAIGDRLGKLIGDTKVYTVGPAEMRALAEGRMKMQPGFEPAGFYDARSGHIVVLDDAMRSPAEASKLLIHEGLHAAFMATIQTSEAARNIIDHLRLSAAAVHFDRGGEAIDHYGLTNAHEFVSEAFSNSEFQRFLASIPADARMIQAFGLDKAPGYALWDVFVAAVRKILGMAPDQHTLLDATLRLGDLLEKRRAELLRIEDEHILGLPREIAHEVDGGSAQESIRAAQEGGAGRANAGATAGALGAGGDGRTARDGLAGRDNVGTADRSAAIDAEPAYDLRPSLRLTSPEERAETEADRAAKAKAFSDVKDAISYRINSDRIAQHPKGPLAGFLGILTRDIWEKGGINVEGVQQDYEGRMAEATEKILEPYGSKWAGLKQDVAGIRDMISEIFGVDTKNETAKTAAKAWTAGVDGFATAEAKRLGKVFTPAEDWRLPQFWESRRAQKFGKATLLADMEREIAAGAVEVFDPDTHEEANPLRMRAILDGAADKIVTDASLGGTPGASGSFRTDMRVFRFADGEAGRDAYLRLMDKYGAGRGGYPQMMQAHVGKVSRELGLIRVLGPGWAEVGEKLMQEAILADKTMRANRAPRDLAQRIRDLPKDTGRFLIGWLESPQKAQAVWEHMSGQASGVGSELMAGLLSEARAFMTSTRMGSALVTAVPADTVNWLMAAKHNGMDMGRMVSEVTKAFLHDTPERRAEAAGLGIVAHAGMDAAIGTKRFEDQFVGEKLMKRMADFVIRAQGLHAWDSAIKRAFPMEMLRTIGQRAGTDFDKLDAPFADLIDRYGLKSDWGELSNPDHVLDTGDAKFLHPDRLPEPVRVKLMSAIYDERQFAYLAGGTERVRAISGQAKAGTLLGELARAIFQFKSFPMTMLATWGMRAAREAGQGKVATLATLITGMTFAGALAMQARALLQGKDPRSMKDPYFWGESFLQGGAAGIYGDFFKEAFSRSDTSLTETMMGPLAAIPAGIQGLTSGARRMAEDGEHVNFGAKLARLISQNTPGGNLWYGRLLASRLLFDNIQRMIDRDYAQSFARQRQLALKTNHQGFWWAPGQNAPGRGPDMEAAFK